MVSGLSFAADFAAAAFTQQGETERGPGTDGDLVMLVAVILGVAGWNLLWLLRVPRQERRWLHYAPFLGSMGLLKLAFKQPPGSVLIALSLSIPVMLLFRVFAKARDRKLQAEQAEESAVPAPVTPPARPKKKKKKKQAPVVELEPGLVRVFRPTPRRSFETAFAVTVGNVELGTHERFELGPVKERNATEDTPQHALERFLTKLENASRPAQKRSWSVMQRSYDPTGAAAQAVYRAVVAARLPAASYELDLTLRPTLPHGIEAIRKLPGGEKEGECCLAEARLGNNTVSIVLRPTPAGHRLLVAGTHALDAQRLSQALGVELIPR